MRIGRRDTERAGASVRRREQERRLRPDRRTPAAPPRVVRGRLGALSVSTAMVAGGWIGFALGLAIGAIMGALLCWFADAVLQWQRDLGFTLGVAQNLLPLGDQIGALRTISREWYLVIPLAAFIGGLIWAILGGLVAGLVGVGYNHASRRIAVDVEFAEPEPATESDGATDRVLTTVTGEPLTTIRSLPVPAPRQAPATRPADDRDDERRGATG